MCKKTKVKITKLNLFSRFSSRVQILISYYFFYKKEVITVLLSSLKIMLTERLQERTETSKNGIPDQIENQVHKHSRDSETQRKIFTHTPSGDNLARDVIDRYTFPRITAFPSPLFPRPFPVVYCTVHLNLLMSSQFFYTLIKPFNFFLIFFSYDSTST